MLNVSCPALQSQHWKEALKILKLCVTKTSTLTMPPPSSSVNLSALEPAILNLPAHTSFAEADISFKKELPGMLAFMYITLYVMFSISLSFINIFGCIHLV